MPSRVILAAMAICIVACSDNAEPSNRCIDDGTVESCLGDVCSEQACRGDERCEEGGCAHWTRTTLWADFELTYYDSVPERIICEVSAGGFPRNMVESLRFTFGDGYSGWGELLNHDYAGPGIYPVALEVRLAGNRILRASRMAVITNGATPPQNNVELTVNEIPDYLNGTIPYRSNNDTSDPADDYNASFHLLVPQSGFTIDVTFLEANANAIDLDSLSLIADVAIAGAAAGTNLAAHLLFDTSPRQRVRRGRWHVATNEQFPLGDVTLTLDAADTGGVSLPQRQITFEAAELTAALDPLDRPMQWLFRFDRDFFMVSSTTKTTGELTLNSLLGSDGEPDFAQELGEIGAQGEETGTGAASVTGRGKTGANAVYHQWIVDAIIAECYRYYESGPDGTPREQIVLTIFAQDDPDAPAATTFTDTGDFSMMRFGGFFSDGAFGYSSFAVYNEGRVDDSTLDRGVATASLLSPLVATPILTDAFAAIKPNTGIPVGEHEADGIVLADGFDPYSPLASADAVARYDDLHRIASFIGKAVGAVTAHEMGHAMGLMPDGAPPDGFFGGRPDVLFMGGNTNSHHADFPGLNLMQAGGNLVSVLTSALDKIEYPNRSDLIELALIFAGENRLSPYSRAYLNRRLIYRDFNGKRRPPLIRCF